jgi:hypothetical protein
MASAIKLRGRRKLHFKFFDKPFCQRINWRGRFQKFFFAKPGQRVTCRSCAKYAEVGR